MTTPTCVGIAIVLWQNHCLVGLRPSGSVLAGYAEFPGGKCEPGEPPQAAVIRECREETGLLVEAVRELRVITHTYDHGQVELHFWLCQPAGSPGDSPVTTPETNGFRWIPLGELDQLRFPEANTPVVQDLLQRHVR